MSPQKFNLSPLRPYLKVLPFTNLQFRKITQLAGTHELRRPNQLSIRIQRSWCKIGNAQLTWQTECLHQRENAISITHLRMFVQLDFIHQVEKGKGPAEICSKQTSQLCCKQTPCSNNHFTVQKSHNRNIKLGVGGRQEGIQADVGSTHATQKLNNTIVFNILNGQETNKNIQHLTLKQMCLCQVWDEFIVKCWKESKLSEIKGKGLKPEMEYAWFTRSSEPTPLVDTVCVPVGVGFVHRVWVLLGPVLWVPLRFPH